MLRPFLLLLLCAGCAEMPMDVPGMPGVTVMVDSRPDPPVLVSNSLTNVYDHLITIYYADGQMQPVMPGETIELRDVKHSVQIANPNPHMR